MQIQAIFHISVSSENVPLLFMSRWQITETFKKNCGREKQTFKDDW